MKVKKLKIDEIQPYERNPRIHSEEQIEKIAQSIREFGYVAPIIVDKNKVIVAGHGRYFALKKLGYQEVPVVVADWLTEEQARAYRIADNRLTELSEWDEELLRQELLELEDFDIDLDYLELGKLVDLEEDGNISEMQMDRMYCLVIDFDSEEELQEAYERFTKEGYKCRPLIS
jgi:ParB-like chromosome segregation protein Spo0J